MKTKKQISKEELAKELEIIKKEGWLTFFEDAANKYAVDIAVLIAIASRETNCNPTYAYCHKFGDNGHGRGLMQIDDRSHKRFLAKHDGKPQPEPSIIYATNLLRANLNRYAGNYNKAVAAYNTGPRNVDNSIKNGRSPDSTTAHGNYGADVLYRASIFKELLKGAQNGQDI